MNFVAFLDESYITAERYRSIGLFSFHAANHEAINKELAYILRDSDVKEFKWKKLRSAKYRFCALKIIDFILKDLHKYDMRVDVLIWDTKDKRHKVPNRNDIANFERMFFHLMKSSMKRRQKKAKWKIFPDERFEIDWETIEQCLSAVGRWQDQIKSPLLGDFITDPYYEIEDFNQVQSHKEPCCQVADLFAGLGAYSKLNYSKYASWELITHLNLNLFGKKNHEFKRSEKERFTIMKRLDQHCKNKKLGVSLKSKKCFTTPNPKNPINFWHYLPQHKMDKAPTRRG